MPAARDLFEISFEQKPAAVLADADRNDLEAVFRDARQDKIRRTARNLVLRGSASEEHEHFFPIHKRKPPGVFSVYLIAGMPLIITDLFYIITLHPFVQFFLRRSVGKSLTNPAICCMIYCTVSKYTDSFGSERFGIESF